MDNKLNSNINEQLLSSNTKSIPSVIENNICKVCSKGRINGTGFLSKIFFFSDDYIPVIIISGQYYEEVNLLTGDEIAIFLKNKKNISITIDNSRTIYKDKEKYGITIVEIKPIDGLDINTFLEINYNMSQDNSANIYKNNLIYLLNYVKENDKIDLYHGIINKINPRNSKIDYYSINGEASIGSPIIKKDNYKIIGIQTGNNNKTGVFIKDLIQEFYTVNLIKKKKLKKIKIH